MNLYEQIQHELDSKSWNYYNMKVGDVLKNTKRSRDFIARYFCEGDKKLVIDRGRETLVKLCWIEAFQQLTFFSLVLFYKR